MVIEPQQLIPGSTEITAEPQLSRRIYGPAVPDAGSPPAAVTLYTVPEGFRAMLTVVIAANVLDASPAEDDSFSLSIGNDAPETRFFNNATVQAGTPFVEPIEITLEEGEFIQAAPTTVAITINARVWEP